MERNNIVSVIVPVFNSERVLERAVDSILAQTYNDIQIILVEGFSSDSSAKMCQRYSDEHDNIDCIFHDKNYGCERARNDGIDNAKGNWFMFLDSDDALPSNAIADMVNAAIEMKCDVLIAGYETINNGIRTTHLPDINEGRYNTKDIASLLLHELSLPIISCVGSKLYKTEIVRNNGLRADKECKHNADLAFAIDVLRVSRIIGVINKVVYSYFLRDGSMSYSYRENLYNSLLNARRKMIDYFKEQGCFSQKIMDCHRIYYDIFMSSCENEVMYHKDFKKVFNRYSREADVANALVELRKTKLTVYDRLFILFTHNKRRGLLWLLIQTRCLRRRMSHG